ncbi:AAA+ ATPase superfamily protein YifB/ComM, associated with DNA recombination [hydrothermal vent metagenome]|uniref:AAA+ ATPase superfamily protein YifB/ComM, associated with DNA recombination n=1 Tax=hydrothermal vent metagenome TaxID=652676 RepID=A0A3B0WG32_9ZZZZ
MQLATLYTRALNGINAAQVTVEVHLSNGLPAFSIVGLPEAAVRESKDRVRAAIINSNFEFPARKITVNLAPADLPKDGGRYDLPIALGILAASGQIDKTLLAEYEFHGELALSGLLREVNGSLPVALAAQRNNKKLIMPSKSATQAALIEHAEIYAADNLLSVCQHLQRLINLPLAKIDDTAQIANNIADMSDVRGQHHTRRALEIAAAGRHNMLMIGPPGTGKSMLASRLPGILPPMNTQQALESASINSISHQGFDIQNWKKRPFRSPHHTASGVALVGGGSKPSPGEISLAHQGVLFLDELTEFNRHTLDVLREPMETGTITISRAARQADFPAQFQLIAAMNPCPQGYACDGKNLCRCSSQQQLKHRNRISAPFLDRIDIHIEVPRIDKQALDITAPKGEPSAQIRQRVLNAFQQQQKRGPRFNAELNTKEIETYCLLKEKEKILLDRAMDKLKLSARAYHRILKLARTIADIDSSQNIETPHLTEAISYRSLDRFISLN